MVVLCSRWVEEQVRRTMESLWHWVYYALLTSTQTHLKLTGDCRSINVVDRSLCPNASYALRQSRRRDLVTS